jgi:hypothetical protein
LRGQDVGTPLRSNAHVLPLEYQLCRRLRPPSRRSHQPLQLGLDR